MSSFLESIKRNWSLFVIYFKADLAKRKERRHISKMAYDAEMLKQLPEIAKAKARSDTRSKIRNYSQSPFKGIPKN